MTEPIDQATKDLIKKEAEEYGYDIPSAVQGYVRGATVWAERLKQERNKVIDECIDAVLDKSTEAERFTKFSYHEVKTILQSIKDKSHE